jgi:hypothetical protein
MNQQLPKSVRDKIPPTVLQHYETTCQVAHIVRAYVNPRTDDVTVSFRDGEKHTWTCDRTGWRKGKRGDNE